MKGLLKTKLKIMLCTKIKQCDAIRNRIYCFLKRDILNVRRVKRNDRINLIDDKYLSKINTNVTTGKERREINNIIDIENFLNKKYENKFKSLYFENLPFEEQIKYFNNAKLIICAHGAVMSNMFFCKEETKNY